MCVCVYVWLVLIFIVRSLNAAQLFNKRTQNKRKTRTGMHGTATVMTFLPSQNEARRWFPSPSLISLTHFCSQKFCVQRRDFNRFQNYVYFWSAHTHAYLLALSCLISCVDGFKIIHRAISWKLELLIRHFYFNFIARKNTNKACLRNEEREKKSNFAACLAQLNVHYSFDSLHFLFLSNSLFLFLSFPLCPSHLCRLQSEFWFVNLQFQVLHVISIHFLCRLCFCS